MLRNLPNEQNCMRFELAGKMHLGTYLPSVCVECVSRLTLWILDCRQKELGRTCFEQTSRYPLQYSPLAIMMNIVVNQMFQILWLDMCDSSSSFSPPTCNPSMWTWKSKAASTSDVSCDRELNLRWLRTHVSNSSREIGYIELWVRDMTHFRLRNIVQPYVAECLHLRGRWWNALQILRQPGNLAWRTASKFELTWGLFVMFLWLFEEKGKWFLQMRS